MTSIEGWPIPLSHDQIDQLISDIVFLMMSQGADLIPAIEESLYFSIDNEYIDADSPVYKGTVGKGGRLADSVLQEQYIAAMLMFLSEPSNISNIRTLRLGQSNLDEISLRISQAATEAAQRRITSE